MSGIMKWFIHNPIAANLMLFLLIIGGLIGLQKVSKESFPSVRPNQIEVSVVYLGAGPEEVEERIVIRIEEAVYDLEGVKRVRSTAREGIGFVTIEAVDDYDMQRLLNDVKSRVDSINTFPRLSERPNISQPIFNNSVMQIALAADLPEAELKELGRRVRNEIAALKGVNRVELNAIRPYEISIEIDEFNLQKYGLSFDDVAQAISRTSVNMPAGKVDNEAGNIQIMTRGQSYTGEDFENIVVLQDAGGTRVLLKDVANVVDGFSEDRFEAHINRKNAVLLNVNVGETPNVTEISKVVTDYVENTLRPSLPDGVEAVIWNDQATGFKSRANTLISNGIGGLILVFLGLMLFLTPRLAGWVVVGIAVSFLGAFMILPLTGESLNMIGMFAFILVLGIVVDDAIIIGENIHRENQRGIKGTKAAVLGSAKVAKPVIFSALTTMIFFAPMAMVPGTTRQFTTVVAVVVILTLIVSLIECLLILPAHLRHGGEGKPGLLAKLFTKIGLTGIVNILRAKADRFLEVAIFKYYKPFLNKCLRRKAVTLSVFVGMLSIVTVGIQYGGHVGFAFQPSIPQDFIRAEYTFPSGVPYDTVKEATRALENSAYEVVKDLEEQYPDSKIFKATMSFASGRGARAFFVLEPGEGRPISTEDITKMWREKTPFFPDAKEIKFDNTFNNDSRGMRIRLSSANVDDIAAAAAELKAKLATYDAIYYVTDTADSAQSEAVLSLIPSAENLGLSLRDLGRQVRQAFYGEEVQRVPRGIDDVKVMVRFPEKDRKSFDALGKLRVRSETGAEVPFGAVANVDYRPAYTSIRRIDRERTLTVIASLEEGKEAEIKKIKDDLKENFFPAWEDKYKTVKRTLGGEDEGQEEFMNSIMTNFIFGLLIIYILFAIAFKSYFKPFIIFTALPFGYMGAVIGHLILGMDISIFSIMGIAAAMGVVINDNLVLVDYISRLRDKGYDVVQAIEIAAEERFRPIFLTSFTTFIGLMPLMLETSVQAQFLIPAVVSLSFGVLFATVVTLILVPILYILMSRIRDRIYDMMGWELKQALPEPAE
ncbi:Acriflavin resistance protein [hydrothermal vent metagenome]|uniref:Acriflavin resistance protein n=1 Tax=hydrothermal vent metagenome TaxID=652676 RepID=A0A3B1B4I4_9ZZZZ